MVRSLLEGVDLAAIRSAADAGPFGMVCACLLDGRVVQHDPSEPGWGDRDRILPGPQAADCVDAAFARHGGDTPERAVRGRPALAVGLGAALGSALDGGIFRIWCLLGPADATGATWDAARAAADRGTAVLTVVGLDPTGELAALLSAAGWPLQRVRLDDPIELLAAMDHALLRSVGPTALLGR